MIIAEKVKECKSTHNTMYFCELAQPSTLTASDMETYNHRISLAEWISDCSDQY